MNINEKPHFYQCLAITLGAYGKALPADIAVRDAWWSLLKSYPMEVVQAALNAYVGENGEFPPIPAGIVKRCRLMDGRPSDEEAWAIALTSRNEADTVVWTTETAAAFSICLPVLDNGDDIGARMAFKQAYNRMVGEARAQGIACKWQPSLGWDLRLREKALTKAVDVGLLPAPDVVALLPAPAASAQGEDSNAKAQLAKIKAMVTQMGEYKLRRAELQMKRAQRKLMWRKKELAVQAMTLEESQFQRAEHQYDNQGD